MLQQDLEWQAAGGGGQGPSGNELQQSLSTASAACSAETRVRKPQEREGHQATSCTLLCQEACSGRSAARSGLLMAYTAVNTRRDELVGRQQACTYSWQAASFRLWCMPSRSPRVTTFPALLRPTMPNTKHQPEPWANAAYWGSRCTQTEDMPRHQTSMLALHAHRQLGGNGRPAAFLGHAGAAAVAQHPSDEKAAQLVALGQEPASIGAAGLNW